jgi:hypothetical protein
MSRKKKTLQMKLRLPCFFGSTICLTGLGVEERRNIQALTELNGGTYSADLNEACTHLIAAQASGEKYAYAKKWGIPVVTVAWFTDCIEKRGLLGWLMWLSLLPLHMQTQKVMPSRSLLKVPSFPLSFYPQPLCRPQHDRHDAAARE